MVRPRYTHCKFCNKPLSDAKIRRFAMTCDQTCWDGLQDQSRNGLKSAYQNLPTGTVGAISELRASVDLMARGFDVFRALSPTCPADLICLKDGQAITVEVRTAYWNRTHTKVVCGRTTTADLLALVIGDEIVYEPMEPEAKLEGRPRLL